LQRFARRPPSTCPDWRVAAGSAEWLAEAAGGEFGDSLAAQLPAAEPKSFYGND
jgi:hypothetical protein